MNLQHTEQDLVSSVTNISHALTKTIGVIADIKLTSPSTFMVFLILAKGKQ